MALFAGALYGIYVMAVNKPQSDRFGLDKYLTQKPAAPKTAAVAEEPRDDSKYYYVTPEDDAFLCARAISIPGGTVDTPPGAKIVNLPRPAGMTPSVTVPSGQVIWYNIRRTSQKLGDVTVYGYEATPVKKIKVVPAQAK